MKLVELVKNYIFMQDITVIIDFLKYKSIKNGVIVGCNQHFNNLYVSKMFIANDIKVSFKNVDTNLFFVRHLHQKIGIYVNTSCEAWSSIFHSIDIYSFKSPFVWIFFTENVKATADILSGQKIELDSDVTIISKRDNVYNLLEVFYTGFGKNGQYVVREMGYWDKYLIMKPQNRKDLRGLVLRTTVVITKDQKVANKTFLKYLEDEQPDLDKVDPLHKMKSFVAMSYLKDMYNVTYEYQRTLSWGYNTNGSFDGMVGALQRGESNIGLSSIFIRTERAEAVDYAVGTWQSGPSFIFRHPKHPSGVYTIYTRPLTARVWYCIAILLGVSTCILGVLLKLDIIKVTGDDGDASFSLAVLCIWSALCQQGISTGRSSTAVKLFIFVIFFYCLILYQYYNATVVSTLLREPPKNIRTLKHLLRSNLKVGVEDILYNRDYFKHTTDPTGTEIYQKKVAHKVPYNYFTAKDGLALVKKGGFAFFIDSAVAYRYMRQTFTEKELCELQQVNIFLPQYLGAAVAKGSPYKELVAYGIRKMKESGIMHRLQSVWDESRPTCVRTPDSSVFSVSLLEFSSAIVALAVGYAAALVILAFEIVMRRADKNSVIEFRN